MTSELHVYLRVLFLITITYITHCLYHGYYYEDTKKRQIKYTCAVQITYMNLLLKK